MRNMYLIFLCVFICLTFNSCRKTEGDEGIITEPRYAVLLNVSSPKLDEIYYPGDEVQIKWNILPEMETANIQLYKKTDYQFTIVPNLPNNGSYNWVIPDDLPQSHHYSVRVVDQGNTSTFAFSDVFFILLK